MSHEEAWVRAMIYRLGKVFHAARRHMPKWMAVVIGIALLIPGPQDELLVAVIIAAWAAFKPAMRRDIREAWAL
jgi:hypothetical protein